MHETTKYDYSKLRGRIRERGESQDKIAEVARMGKSTLSQRLNNKGVFKQDEIIAICEYLEIQTHEIGAYFFAC